MADKNEIVILGTEGYKYGKVISTRILPDWNTVQTGAKFKGFIDEREVEGRVDVTLLGGHVYLCHNESLCNGTKSELGILPDYQYSWVIYGDILSDTVRQQNDVCITFIENDPIYVAPKHSAVRLTNDYIAKIKSTSVKVGCQTIPFQAVKEVYEAMVELQTQEAIEQREKAIEYGETES